MPEISHFGSLSGPYFFQAGIVRYDTDWAIFVHPCEKDVRNRFTAPSVTSIYDLITSQDPTLSPFLTMCPVHYCSGYYLVRTKVEKLWEAQICIAMAREHLRRDLTFPIGGHCLDLPEFVWALHTSLETWNTCDPAIP